MKLVLLPGLDGTAKLFRAFASAVALPTVPIAYPVEGPQDPATLARHVRTQWPPGNGVVVAESFSGPIGLRLAVERPEGLRGLVLVNSFARAPWWGLRTLAAFVQAIPVPIHASIVRHLLLDATASDALVEQVRAVVTSVPAATLAARLRALAELEPPPALPVPRLELVSTGDRLVRARDYGVAGPVERRTLPGPHLLLQRHPDLAARAIEAFVADFASPEGIE